MRYRLFSLLLLALAVAIAYTNAVHGEFIFDDARIYNNPHIRITTLTWSSVREAMFESEPVTRPVANLSFALNYLAGGYRVEGYRLTNIAIHLASGFMLYLLFCITLQSPALSGSGQGRMMGRLDPQWLAFFAALLWLVHPLQTQAVTYVVQRMTSLAALLSLLSLYWYVRFRQAAAGPGRGWLYFAASCLAGLLAMGCKESSVTLPFFILLYEWYFLEDLDTNWLRRRAVPVALAVLLVGGVALLILGPDPVAQVLNTYQSRPFTPLERLLTEWRVLFFYLSLLALPLPGRLNLDHDFTVSTSLLHPATTIAAGAGLLILLAAAVWAARRERLLSFAILWFFGNLVVESSVIGLELVFEHRLYLPAMFLFIAAVAGGDRLVPSRRAKSVVLVALALLLAFWTSERNRVWHDRISLWSDVVAKSPGKARPHNNLGVALKRHGRLAEAEVQYRAAIKADPTFYESYNNLANILVMEVRRDEALALYDKALELKPGSAMLHNNIGRLLMEKGRYGRAMMHFAEALRLDPDFADARYNLRASQEAWQLQSGAGKSGL